MRVILLWSSSRLEKFAIQNSLKDTKNEEKKKQLEKVANIYGFKCHDMGHDGNCFFKAIAHQLNEIKHNNRMDYNRPLSKLLIYAELE